MEKDLLVGYAWFGEAKFGGISVVYSLDETVITRYTVYSVRKEKGVAET